MIFDFMPPIGMASKTSATNSLLRYQVVSSGSLPNGIVPGRIRTALIITVIEKWFAVAPYYDVWYKIQYVIINPYCILKLIFYPYFQVVDEPFYVFEVITSAFPLM